MGSLSRAELSTSDINDLPDSAFAYIEPGNPKDGSGKTVPRSARHFPIHDKAHADNAAARIAQGAEFGKEALPKVKAAQKKFGSDVSSDSGAEGSFGRSDPFSDVIMRVVPLDDIQIQRNGDGRTVEAYAAAYDVSAEIQDHEGHYNEVIDRTAFDKAIAKRAPQGARRSWTVGVFYNHALTLHGTPSERADVPIGTPLDIKSDGRGLLTVTRYNKTPLADEVLEAIRDGSITGQSFTGRIIRSEPSLSRADRRRGGHQPDAQGGLTTVRRMELGLSEYGPTPMPAYADAAILGVRSMLLQQHAPTGHEGADPRSRHKDIVRRNRERGITP